MHDFIRDDNSAYDGDEEEHAYDHTVQTVIHQTAYIQNYCFTFPLQYPCRQCVGGELGTNSSTIYDKTQFAYSSSDEFITRLLGLMTDGEGNILEDQCFNDASHVYEDILIKYRKITKAKIDGLLNDIKQKLSFNYDLETFLFLPMVMAIMRKAEDILAPIRTAE